MPPGPPQWRRRSAIRHRHGAIDTRVTAAPISGAFIARLFAPATQWTTQMLLYRCT